MIKEIKNEFSEAYGPISWPFLAEKCVKKNQICVLIFVTSHQGSTPRETGSWLFVSSSEVVGTLGGGEIEHSSIIEAQDILAGRQPFIAKCKNFQLGPDLDQCCGGAMAIFFLPVNKTALSWLETACSFIKKKRQGSIIFDTSAPSSLPELLEGEVPINKQYVDALHVQQLYDIRPKVILYGAGHVGRAIAAISLQLPIQLILVDGRQSQLAQVPIGENVKSEYWNNPVFQAKKISSAKAAIIMTHSHGLDYRLCQSLIKNSCLLYIGLIGSKTKAERFRRALKKEGNTDSEIAKIISPIGRDGPRGKEPGIIALSVLSEVISKINSSVSFGDNIELDRGRIK